MISVIIFPANKIERKLFNVERHSQNLKLSVPQLLSPHYGNGNHSIQRRPVKVVPTCICYGHKHFIGQQLNGSLKHGPFAQVNVNTTIGDNHSLLFVWFVRNFLRETYQRPFWVYSSFEGSQSSVKNLFLIHLRVFLAKSDFRDALKV